MLHWLFELFNNKNPLLQTQTEHVQRKPKTNSNPLRRIRDWFVDIQISLILTQNSHTQHWYEWAVRMYAMNVDLVFRLFISFETNIHTIAKNHTHTFLAPPQTQINFRLGTRTTSLRLQQQQLYSGCRWHLSFLQATLFNRAIQYSNIIVWCSPWPKRKNNGSLWKHNCHKQQPTLVKAFRSYRFRAPFISVA